MMFTYDFYKRLKQSQVFLANPQKNYIGLLSGVKELHPTPNFNTLSEISFKVYEKENDLINKYYNKIEVKRLVEIQYIGWFQIQNVSENDDGQVAYKEVKCISLENELIGKRIYDINGVFGLCDTSDTEHSLLHIIAKESGWGIGNVDPSLLNKWRTFSIDSAQIYNLLVQDVSKSFDCCFVFDTYAKTISAHKLSNMGELTDIVISRKNILKEWIQESNADSIITKLKIVGADGVDIRAVNPTSTNYLINVDYFRTTEWMTQGLINSLDLWQAKYNTNLTTYTTTLSQLKTYQSELTVLTAQLTDLESQQNAEEDVQGTYIELYKGTPPTESADYPLYLASVNNINTIKSQIVAKEVEITTKESQITSTRNSLDSIGTDLDMSTNFTQEQLKELNIFLTENEEYQDSTFVITDAMTQEEITDMKIELMNNGASELQRASQPQFTIKITASNLFSIIEDDTRSISLDKWKEKLQIGNLITIKFRPDYWVTARLIKMDIDFDNLTDIELTFSNKNRFDDELVQLSELIAQSGRTASALSLSKFGYDKASSITSDVQEFMTGTFNATTNAMKNNDNVETEFGKFGIKNRQWLPDQNKYSDYQSWWNQNTLLFSSDGFNTSKAGIGLFTNTLGETFYGVLADVICGNLIMGSSLNITNQSGNYTINDNGFTATATVGANTYSAGINPSTPSEIINVKVNGANQFFIDTNTQSLVFKGQITGGSMNINEKFLVSSSGILTAVDGIFSGKITAKDGNIGGFTIDTTQLTAGTTNKFMRISPFSTTPGTNNYTTAYGSIDLGRTSDGLDTLIHIRSDGYARFGLNSQNGAVKFNYTDTGGTTYSFYTPNFRIESGNGFVTARYIYSVSGEDLIVTSTNANLIVGADYGTATLYGDTVQIQGYNGLPLTYNGNNVITSATNYHGTLYASSNSEHISVYFSEAGNFVSTSAGDLGTTTNRWDGAWLSAGYSTTSDRNLKNTINPLSDIYYEFFKRLIPVSFKYNDGTSDRLHIGFISQDVETAMQEVGLSSLEFAGFIKAPIYAEYDEEQEPIIESGIVNYMYFLRYEEFIAINTYVTQKQESKLSEQNIKLQELENRILQLESV